MGLVRRFHLFLPKQACDTLREALPITPSPCDALAASAPKVNS